ncbi:transcriptional regulator, TetR family [Actinoalloteichus sp. GBA129-24]|uniref:Transcriptional regulator, TetR family n=2 Tax=Pseudonocardiaceae TaxID=2070 RepID=A0AAC9PUX1_9PSEU|nr:transcriptional regulator, TetR family [Actinoalloteichus fjordicus]APU23755.1 transcriptional regulator, TetR family [Actinoalloteichus sp. GBA129-24]
MSLRDNLLCGAADLLAERGFARLRMSEVAAMAGVSRQTVYNEFGGKETLAHTVVLNQARICLERVGQAIRGADDPVAGIRAAVRRILEISANDPLLTSLLTGIDREALLPFLPVPDLPTLRALTELISRQLHSQLPQLPPASTTFYADTVVRLTISHLLIPTATTAEAADAVTAIAAAVLSPHLPIGQLKPRPLRPR